MWIMLCETCCDVACGCGVEWCGMWNMLHFELWWCEMVVPRQTALLRDLRWRIWWSEMRCAATLNVCEM